MECEVQRHFDRPSIYIEYFDRNAYNLSFLQDAEATEHWPMQRLSIYFFAVIFMTPNVDGKALDRGGVVHT